MTRSRLVFDRAVPEKPRRGAVTLSFSMGLGVHAIVGRAEDGLESIVPLCAGLARPRSGRVLIDGRDPFGDPALRERVGAMGSAACLPLFGNVRQLFLRTQRRIEILGALGIAAYANRRLAALSPAEARAVELALALASPEPLVLALSEPFANVGDASRAATLDALHGAAASGACVIVTTTSMADATDLRGRVHLLEQGRIARSLDATEAVILPGRGVEFRVETDDPRALAAMLASDEAVLSITWNAERGESTVAVRGIDQARTALSIARAARAAGARIHSITPAAPSLDEVRAASAGLALAAYHAAYRYGSPQPPATLPAGAEDPS